MKIFTSILTGLALLSAASAYAAPADEIITEDPAGEVQWYSCMSMAYSPSVWGFVNYSIVDGVARKVVFGEDGYVYFRDPISLFPTKSYVKGTREGNRISISVPQTIMVYEGKDGSENVCTIGLLESHREWDPEFESYITNWTTTSRTEIIFDYLPNGTIRQSAENADLRLTFFVNGAEMVYGDTDISMTPVDPTKAAVRFPEDVEPDIWTLSYKQGARRVGYNVEATRVDDEIYIRGFWHKYPNATIKGYVENGQLIIPAGQYLGWIEKDNVTYFEYTVSYKMGGQNIMDYFMLTDDDLIFDIDEQTGTYTLVSGETEGMIVKGGENVGYEVDKNQYDLRIIQPGFQKFTGSFEEPMAPEYINDIYRVFTGVDVPFVQVEFAILPFDLNGNALDSDYLRYSMWFDDERVYFENTEEFPNYQDLPEPTYELPLNFRNNWGIMYEDDNIFQHRIQLAGSDPDKIGAQVIFYDPETEIRRFSKIAYYYPATKTIKYEDDPASVMNPEAEGDVTGVFYYDLLGNRVGKDYKGICVKAVNYSNGAVKTYKVAR